MVYKIKKGRITLYARLGAASTEMAFCHIR